MDFQSFKHQYGHKTVNEFSNHVTTNPLLSICIQTYQHIGFIEQCLQSILSQQTNFPIEILIGEDSSTDGTREICIEFAKRYPDKIRLFLHHRENVIHINGHPTGRFNFLYNLLSARGKYIALCEGDDYWTDPNKLQMQVDFLESHSDYSMCLHKAEMVQADKVVGYFPSLSPQDTLTTTDLLPSWQYPTASMVFRAEIIKSLPRWLIQSPTSDLPIAHLLSETGKIKYMDECMSVYRLHGGGVSNLHTGYHKIHIMKEMYSLLDKHTHYTFHTEYQKAIAWQVRHHLSINKDKVNAVERFGWMAYVHWLESPRGLKDKIIYYANVVSPKLYQTYLKIKGTPN